jgi:transposase
VLTIAQPLELRVSDADRNLLRSWTRAGTVPQRVARRAQIVLLAADGLSARDVARRLNVDFRTALLWRRRYSDRGPQALWHDAAGRGRPRTLDGLAEAKLRHLLATKPLEGRWSIRKLAAATGLSRASVHRLLQAG